MQSRQEVVRVMERRWPPHRMVRRLWSLVHAGFNPLSVI
ncbi:hypothetical protein SynA1825c_00883 [Synechococcus sp. A18-25c]|nr:hypothetical protein SynA1825c_00883 [Synechococcus sp. A18-25c]